MEKELKELKRLNDNYRRLLEFIRVNEPNKWGEIISDTLKDD